jgi:uncharacterized protein (DUF433 family)
LLTALQTAHHSSIDTLFLSVILQSEPFRGLTTPRQCDTLHDLESKLLALTPIEKLEAIQILSHSLSRNWRGITKTLGVCGGDACIAGTRIPVWVLVQAQNLGISEIELLHDYPTLSVTDLANAWIYAEANAEEIETAIQENEAA